MKEKPNEATAKPETVAEMFLYLPDAAKRQELEQFRIEYESLNGPTDLTRRYTSTWPKPQQDWMYENHTNLWFDGLPPFAKAYIRGQMELPGSLDDMPDRLIRLYVSGGMKPGNQSERGR